MCYSPVLKQAQKGVAVWGKWGWIGNLERGRRERQRGLVGTSGVWESPYLVSVAGEKRQGCVSAPGELPSCSLSQLLSFPWPC
jgi:hypothetical protein